MPSGPPSPEHGNPKYAFYFPLSDFLKAEPLVDTGSESSVYPTDVGLQTNAGFY